MAVTRSQAKTNGAVVKSQDSGFILADSRKRHRKPPKNKVEVIQEVDDLESVLTTEQFANICPSVIDTSVDELAGNVVHFQNDDNDQTRSVSNDQTNAKVVDRQTRKSVRFFVIPNTTIYSNGPEDIPTMPSVLIRPNKNKRDSDSICLISWNVGSLRSFMQKRPEDLLKLCREELPDVIGIMETKLTPGKMEADMEATLKSLIEPVLGRVDILFNSCLTQKGYSGTLLIIRNKTTGVYKAINNMDDFALLSTYIIPSEFAATHEKVLKEGRVMQLEIIKKTELGSIKPRSLFMVLCYVPNSMMDLQRLEYRVKCFDKVLSSYCYGLATSKESSMNETECATTVKRGNSVYLLGDLNVAIRDVDIWNVEKPHLLTMPGTTHAERFSFMTNYNLNLTGLPVPLEPRRELENDGTDATVMAFEDTFATCYPDATGWFSYWSVRANSRGRNRGLRLDYVLRVVPDKALVQNIAQPISETDELVDVFILREYSEKGDHCPVGCCIQWT